MISFRGRARPGESGQIREATGNPLSCNNGLCWRQAPLQNLRRRDILEAFERLFGYHSSPLLCRTDKPPPSSGREAGGYFREKGFLSGYKESFFQSHDSPLTPGKRRRCRQRCGPGCRGSGRTGGWCGGLCGRRSPARRAGRRLASRAKVIAEWRRQCGESRSHAPIPAVRARRRTAGAAERPETSAGAGGGHAVARALEHADRPR